MRGTERSWPRLWLRKVKQRHRTLAELVASLKDQPDEAWPLYELASQAEAAAKARPKSQAALYAGFPQQRANLLVGGERHAARDIASLFYLFTGLNERFMTEKRALWLQLALAASHYARWINDTDREADRLVEILMAAISEISAWTFVLDAPMEQYYKDECPLLGEAEEALLEMVEYAEWLVEHFNDQVQFKAKGRTESKKRKPALPKLIHWKRPSARRSPQPTRWCGAWLICVPRRAR